MLFTPIKIGNLEIPNRVVVAPMCQYSAVDGVMTDWHTQHLMQLGYSGAGLVMIEATAVERVGRITHHCAGLYNEFCAKSLKEIFVKAKAVASPNTSFGIQLSHAGRKASSQRPWEGRKSLKDEEDPWPTLSASSIPFDDDWHIPHSMSKNDMDRIKKKFVEAAIMSLQIGFDLI